MTPVEPRAPAPLSAADLERLRETARRRAAADAIPRRPPAAVVPLSLAQRRLWLQEQLDPGSPIYNLPGAWRLRQPLDRRALTRAFRDVIDRHEALRVSVDARDGEPIQRIADSVRFRLAHVDLSIVPADAVERITARLLRQVLWHPFDLRRAPLCRVAVVSCAGDDHLLLVGLHHLIADAWSLNILARELALCYDARRRGGAVTLPPLPVQFGDYAVWEEASAAGARFRTQIDYWRRQLAGMPVLHLAGEGVAHARRTSRGARVRVRVDAATTNALRALAQEQGTTLFVTLSALFAAWVFRYAGQTDFGLGVPMANRRRRDLEGMIGFFVNTVVLRMRPESRLSFRALVAQARATVLDALANQDVPFERIVEAVQPERHGGGTPLSQVMLSVQPAPDVPLTLGGAALQRVVVEEQTARFDLTVSLIDRPDGLVGSWNYSTDLFDGGTAIAMERHFQQLLRQVVAHPDVEIALLPVVPEAEWRAWAEAPAAPSGGSDRPPGMLTGSAAAGAPAHAWIDAWSAHAPDALAAVGDGWQIAFGVMIARANQTARRLRTLGIRRGGRVALCADRSPEFLIAMLGIIKAGAAYVALDPAYPPARLRQMFRASAAQLAIAHASYASSFDDDARVVDLDDCTGDPGAGGFDGRAIDLEAGGITADDPAYVVFTSGSTGEPKAVIVPHRALVNSALAVIAETGMRPGDCFLQFASPSVDVSAFQIFPALMAGAALAMHPRPGELSNDEIAALCDRLRVTVLDLPAALWQPWIADRAARGGTGPAFPASVRVFMTGGESVSGEALRTWGRLAAADARFISSYGPTEAAATTVFTISGAAARLFAEPRLPIGRPNAAVRAHVLDRALQPLPPGAIGELFIGGAGLAHSYLMAAAATADRFVPDPLGGAAGSRLYRTGDRARVRVDGTLEFHGRQDRQVKIRGSRIEIAEIEAHLAHHPAVAAVAVAVRTHAGAPELIAYVVRGEGADAAATGEAALQAFVRERLPDAFVPSRVMFLASLPLRPNGKVDREALPAPPPRARDAEAGADAARAPGLAPLTATERLLAGMWHALLAIDPDTARRDDDFFLLGGHSLLAVRLVSRIRDVFAIDLPLRAVFENSTLHALAEAIDRERSGASSADAIRLVPRPDGVTSGPLAPTQRAFWFLQQLETTSAYVNIDRFHVKGPLRLRLLARALAAIVQRHEALRTVFVERDGVPVQIVQPAGVAAAAGGIGSDIAPLPLIDLQGCGSAGEPLAREIARMLGRRPHDLARGPLLHATAVRFAPDDHLVFFEMPHIVSDGWSMGILIDEVSTLYRAALDGREAVLPDLPIQFLDYARWEAARREHADFQRDAERWTERVRGASSSLALPYDRPRPDRRRLHGGRTMLSFSPEVSRQVREWSRQEGLTPFMTLLAALQLVLHGYTGQDTILVMTPMANRTRTETERLIGLFMNHVPVITRFAPEHTLRELLRAVRTATLDAFAHQALPFDEIVSRLQPERGVYEAPLHQVLFNVLNVPFRPLSLADVDVDAPSVAAPAGAHFDLSVVLDDTRERLTGRIEYDRDLFDEDTIARMAGDYHRLLAWLMNEPEWRVGDLALETPAQARLREAFSGALQD